MNQATVSEAMSKRWKVYDPAEDDYTGVFAEGLRIVTDTEPMLEVVGCSEWMRAERDVFDYIVALHNDRLAGRLVPT